MESAFFKRRCCVLFLSLIALSVGSCRQRELKSNMAMAEVERVFGKPDRVETRPGSIDAKYESPTVICWYYARYPVKESGKNYGDPGHINFVPIRFTKHESNMIESDKVAREYGEQSDAFRTFSYSGSFPTKNKYWDEFGPVDGLPLKELAGEIKKK